MIQFFFVLIVGVASMIILPIWGIIKLVNLSLEETPEKPKTTKPV